MNIIAYSGFATLKPEKQCRFWGIHACLYGYEDTWKGLNLSLPNSFRDTKDFKPKNFMRIGAGAAEIKKLLPVISSGDIKLIWTLAANDYVPPDYREHPINFGREVAARKIIKATRSFASFSGLFSSNVHVGFPWGKNSLQRDLRIIWPEPNDKPTIETIMAGSIAYLLNIALSSRTPASEGVQALLSSTLAALNHSMDLPEDTGINFLIGDAQETVDDKRVYHSIDDIPSVRMCYLPK